jgi:hypothetical protein
VSETFLKSTVSFEPFDPGLNVGVLVFFVVFDIGCTVIILRERHVLVLKFTKSKVHFNFLTFQRNLDVETYQRQIGEWDGWSILPAEGIRS